VLDHAGMPIDRRPSELTRWRRALSRLAVEPNTTVKISALGTNDHHWTVNSIQQIVVDTIDTFGPDRCMFASNFPVDAMHGTYDELYGAYDGATADLDAETRDKLFAANAERVYRC
jgi:predicted TIM-barrel fold metal-dependent hydrolase